MAKLILTLVGAVIVVLAGLGYWMASGSFGRVPIQLRNGSMIYAVRESRGLSFEQLSLTRDPTGCKPADPAVDYIYRNPADPIILYAVTAEGLTIYDYPFNRIVEEPRNDWVGFSVRVSRTKDPFYDDVRANPEKYGGTRLSIPLNETCWSSILRRFR